MSLFSPSPSHARARFLSRTLWADAICCAAAGAVQLAFAQPLAVSTGLPQALLLGTGCFLLAWACVAGWGARRMPRSRGLVALAVFGNFGWALGCGIVLYSGVLDLAPAGWAWVLGQAAIGVALGDVQCAVLWRSRASLAGSMTTP
ncbi:hypothetical protein [Delftia sp. UME58]|uniref:hypothetical protein n=1 Tax=Delftia sp. UME58 TaxID=1862322 RepID=UPI0016021B36|nr:hypothetical protein [Delftia sp. UME58]MBB1652287.1 hypothetical protein [Delftia sp. UME58]